MPSAECLLNCDHDLCKKTHIERLSIALNLKDFCDLMLKKGLEFYDTVVYNKIDILDRSNAQQ